MSEESRQQQRRASERQPQIINTQTAAQNMPIIQNPTTKKFKACNILTSIFFYLFWIDAALVYLVFYIFGYMGRGVSHDILSVFIIVLIVVIPTLIWKNSTKIAKFRLIKKELIFTVVCLLLWTGVAVFSVIALKGACLCYYNDNYGFTVGNQMGPYLSTEWTRTNGIDKICKQGRICNIYATVGLNTSSQFFLNIHSGNDLQNITIKYNSSINQIHIKNISYRYRLDNIQDIGKRLIHSLYINNLTADTLYNIYVFKTPADNQTFGTPVITTAYKTIPDRNAQTLRMAIGGDVGMTHEGIKITQNLVNFNPDVIIIGGDNSYDDGMRTCYYSWDNFYNLFDNLNQKLGRLVPIIMSVGNHDVGFDSMANVDISDSYEDIPLYFMYNPQHLNTSGKMPLLSERQTNHTHIIGPTVHLHLDSGYIKSFESQSKLISETGQKYKNYYLFANYHNPIYPSCTDLNDGSNDKYVIQNGTQYWTPYFDQYNFIACFQHHTHHKKFTNKLKNGTNTKDGSGTRYVGDGSWGVLEGSCPQNKISATDKFEFWDTKEPNHIWLVTLTKSNQSNYLLNYTAIDVNGQIKNNETRTDILKNII